MKTYLYLFSMSLWLIGITAFAQVPELMQYQAIVRDGSGALMRESSVGMQFTILQSSENGIEIYRERQNALTNSNGLLTLRIGDGEDVSGSIGSIDWHDGPYFLRTEIDPSGGNQYQLMGYTQLLSVPFAFHAATADSLNGGYPEQDGSVLNELQFLRVSATGDTLYITKGNWVVIPGISEANPRKRIDEVSFVSLSLMNNPMGNAVQRNVSVYLPPHYVEGDDFPVVYLLHGIPFGSHAYLDEQAWYEAGLAGAFTPPEFPEEGFVAWIDQMITTGKIQEMIIVMPDAISGYGMSMYSDSELNGDYERLISEDLVNFIDANYKTRQDAVSRAIMGHSMGGYGAVMLGMKYPDVFGIVAAHSPILNHEVLVPGIQIVIAENPDGMLGPDPTKFMTSAVYAFSAAWSPNLNDPPFYVDLPFAWPNPGVLPAVWARWLEHNPIVYFTGHPEQVQALHGLYLDIGESDELGFYAPVNWSAFISALDQYDIAYTFNAFAGTHWSKLYERLGISLEFVSERLQ